MEFKSNNTSEGYPKISKSEISFAAVILQSDLQKIEKDVSYMRKQRQIVNLCSLGSDGFSFFFIVNDSC